MNFWLVVTSPDNFKHDREHLGFRLQGIPIRYRNSLQKMQISDKVVYYIMILQKFGATAIITGHYVEDYTKVWTDEDEMWPARRPSEPEIILQDDELIDAKKMYRISRSLKTRNTGARIFKAAFAKYQKKISG